MAQNKLPLIGGALGVLAVGATALMLLSSGSAPPPAPNAAQAQPVEAATLTRYVARTTISPRTEITRAMLRAEEVQKSEAGADAVTDPNQVLGKLAGMRIQPGQTVTSAMLIEPVQRVIPANFAVPSGLRAVGLWLDPASTAGGLVDVGDHVDVIVTHKSTLENQSTDTTEQLIDGKKEIVSGRTIAQNLMVLAVDRSLERPPAVPTPVPGAPGSAPPPAAAPTPIPQPGSISRTRVIVAAPPNVAQRLAAANDSGNIHLTIRNPNSGEQDQMKEAIEYPTRVITVRKKDLSTMSKSERKDAIDLAKNIFGNGNGGNNQPLLPPMQTPSLPQVSVPVGPSTPAAQMPMAPQGKEVTVIRGTEKTRVLVNN